MARVPRGLGHLQLWYLEAACQCQALAPSPERAVAAISLYRVMRIFHPEHLTIDCSPDVGPGVKLQDMKQFPINPDCAPAPAASHSPPPRLRHCKNNKLSYLQSWARASEQDGSALRVWPGYSSDSGLNITLGEYYKG